MTFLLMYWKYIAVALVIVGLTGAVKVQSVRLDHSKAETASVQAAFDLFKAKVKQEGEAAQAVARAKEAADKLAKEKADAENKRIHDADISTIIRLRRERDSTTGGKLPAAPAGSSRPDLICFDRAAYQSAYGELVAEVRGLADEGTASTIDLNTAKSWAGGLK